MKRTALILLLLLLVSSFLSAEAVNETNRYWVIDHYEIKAVMDESGILTVQEKIVANFHGQYHGIVKTIPVTNDVKNIKCSRAFAVETENKELIIRMGDAENLVSGSVEYVLTYEMNPKIKREFFYMIPGEWDVDIHDLEYSITVPGGKFFECSISSFDGMPAGKTFETSENEEGDLVIKGSSNLVPAWGYLELVLR